MSEHLSQTYGSEFAEAFGEHHELRRKLEQLERKLKPLALQQAHLIAELEESGSRLTETTRGHPYVPKCEYNPETNGLGRVQRRIVSYLGTAPAGFGGYSTDLETGEFGWHTEPVAVTLGSITAAVYEAKESSPAQIRAVQRAIKRLEELGLVVSFHAAITYREYDTPLGFHGTQAVPGRWVALKWDCEHLRALYERQQTRRP